MAVRLDFLRVCAWEGVARSGGSVSLTRGRTAGCLLQGPHRVTCPPTRREDASVSFYYNRPGGCEAESHYGSDLHFPMAEDTEHLLPGVCILNSDLSFYMGTGTTVFDCFVFHLSPEYSPSPTVFLALISYSCEDWGPRSLPIHRPPSPLAFCYSRDETWVSWWSVAHAPPRLHSRWCQVVHGSPALLVLGCVTQSQRLHLSEPQFLPRTVVRPVSFRLPLGCLLCWTLFEGLCNAVAGCLVCARPCPGRRDMTGSRQHPLPRGAHWLVG